MSSTREKGDGAVSIFGIAIVADRFEEQVAFYRDELGLVEVANWGDAVRLKAANGVELTIFAATHDRRSMARLAPATKGLSHLEFGIQQPSRSAREEQLRADGRESHPGNFLDPDGQLFHFVNVERL